MSHRARALAILAGVIAVAITPLTAAAHVNRTAGPYAFLLFLVEEPTFEDNHAGFEFWVHDGEVPMEGLETALHAQAAGHGQVVDLAINPVDASGFYVLDHSPNGVAFDPLGGGEWTLTLTGSVHATRISLQFPVLFPSYPRVGTPASVVADGAATKTGGVLWLVAASVGVLGASVSLAVIRRRISRRRGR